MLFLGMLTGFGLTITLLIFLIWLLLNTIANWKLLSKAGHSGIQSLIPVWNTIARYGVSWSKLAGLIVVVLGLVVASYTKDYQNGEQISVTLTAIGAIVSLFEIIEKFKLSKVYGHGFFFGLGLIICEPLFIMILAFGSSQYVGKNR